MSAPWSRLNVCLRCLTEPRCGVGELCGECEQEAREEWLPIPDFPGYEASSLGRIRSYLGWRGRLEAEPHIRKLVDHPTGYLQIKLGNRTRWVTRLVALTFLGPTPNGMETCHNNGIRTDNRVSNLRYDTPRNNQADKVRHGTNLRKLTPAAVAAIRSEYVKGRGPEFRGNARDLAARFGISTVYVAEVARGDSPAREVLGVVQ